MSNKTKAERKFQAELIKEIKMRFPGSMVLKNDSSYIQGIPDLTVLCDSHWATLEVKKAADSPHQPNQDYYIETMDNMSFSRFIFPENKEEVLNELEQSFKA